MRSAIDINHCGIFLGWVEVHRLNHAVVEVGDPVIGLDSAAGVLGHIISLPGIGRCEVAQAALPSRGQYGDVARHGGLGIVVGNPSAILVNHCAMPSLASLVDARALACCHVHTEEVALDGAYLVARDQHRLVLGVKSQHLHHHPVATGELLYERAIGIV